MPTKKICLLLRVKELKNVAEHNDFGKAGEEIARNYLIKNSYRIIEYNWRTGKLELDIIAENENFIVFVEVKTRHSRIVEEPESSVNKKKQKQIIKAADIYLRINDINTEARFDIISILIEKNNININHIKDAFYPTL